MPGKTWEGGHILQPGLPLSLPDEPHGPTAYWGLPFHMSRCPSPTGARLERKFETFLSPSGSRWRYSRQGLKIQFKILFQTSFRLISRDISKLASCRTRGASASGGYFSRRAPIRGASASGVPQPGATSPDELPLGPPPLAGSPNWGLLLQTSSHQGRLRQRPRSPNRGLLLQMSSQQRTPALGVPSLRARLVPA